jgi:hypothetical protein
LDASRQSKVPSGDGRADKHPWVFVGFQWELEPDQLAALPAADDRGGHLVGVDPEPGPGLLRPGAQLLGQIGGEDEVVGLVVGGGW